MPNFAFIAKDRMGNSVQGHVEAQDLAFAANKVGQMGYTLVELVPSSSPPSAPVSPAPATGDRTTAFERPAGQRQVAADPTTSFSPPPATAVPLDATTSFSRPPAAPAPVDPNRTHAVPLAAQRTGGGAPANPPEASAQDILQADLAKRRKVEMDLAKMGMKPSEIQRLLDANANTTAGPAGSLAPAMPFMPTMAQPAAKKPNAHAKVAARAADLHSFAAQLQSTAAADRTRVVEEVKLDLPELRESTIEERRQAESILREVYALRKRERFAEALAKCREALEMVPGDAAALEMYGDLFQGVARTDEAMAAYKRATEADSSRASAERKYGDLLVRQQQWVEPDTEEVPRNPIAAAAFSLLIPGAGQIHNGQRVKGAILVVCAVLSMAVMLYLYRDRATFKPSWEKGAPVPATTRRVKAPPIDWNAEAPTLACVIVYTALSLGSAVDAAAVAQRNNRLR